MSMEEDEVTKPPQINVFQIYTQNGSTILPSVTVNKNLGQLDEILKMNIKELETILGPDEAIIKYKEEENEDEYEEFKLLNECFTFNGIDLTPSDALRGALDSKLYTKTDDSVAMPITYSNQMAQFMDFLSQDTGTRYFSSYFKEAESELLPEDVAEGVAEGMGPIDDDSSPVSSDSQKEIVYFLDRNIQFHINQLFEDPTKLKIYGYLFNCMRIFLEEYDKLDESLKLDYRDEIIDTYFKYVLVYGILLNTFPVLMTFILSTNTSKLFDGISTNIYEIFNLTLSEGLSQWDTIIESLDNFIKKIINTAVPETDHKAQLIRNIIYYNILKEIYNFTNPFLKGDIIGDSLGSSVVMGEGVGAMEVANHGDEILAQQLQDFGTQESTQEEEWTESGSDEEISEENSVGDSEDSSEYEEGQYFNREGAELGRKRRGENNDDNSSNNKRTKANIYEYATAPRDLLRLHNLQNFHGETVNAYGGSCERINLRNALLSVKLYFEWQHDFGPLTARAPTYTKGAYQYPEFYDTDNIFYSIMAGWDTIMGYFKQTGTQSIFPIQSGEPDEVDKTIFKKLTESGKHDEPTYMSNIVDSLMEHCPQMKDDFMYIPIAEFKFKSEENEEKTNQFFDKVFQYYGDQRMFIKPSDKIDGEVHLSITSDNTPIDNLNEDKELGYMLQDMKSIGGLEIALATYRKGLYEAWDTVSQTSNKVAAIFNGFKETTDAIIKQAKSPELDIKTPANLIDPITTGAFDSVIYPVGSNPLNQVIKQNKDSFDTDSTFQNVIYLATIYGMNQLLNFWIDDTKVVLGYLLSGDSTSVNTIKFYIPETEYFDWCVGDSTINTICGALINIMKNIPPPPSTSLDTIIDDETNLQQYLLPNQQFVLIARKSDSECVARWNRLYHIASVIMFHSKFRYPRTIKTFMVILSYLKSCGDEFQRLTCEFINYAMDLPSASTMASPTASAPVAAPVAAPEMQEYLLRYLPDGSKLPSGVEVKDIFENMSLFLLTQDRILVGESIEKDTPVFTSLKCPNDAFYDDPDEANDFISNSANIKGETVSRTSSGILSNRRTVISEPRTIGVDDITKNTEIINKFLTEIVLKMSVPLPFSVPEGQTYELDATNNISLTPIPTDNIATLNSHQQVLISILSKISLALTYYDAGVTDTIYEQLIDGEIYKAVSLTIDSNLLNTILLKNSKRAPQNVKALETLITNMYDEPEVVDKLIESYEKACDLLKEKLVTYINILNLNSQLLSTKRVNFEPVIEKYQSYIDSIEGIGGKKVQFSTNILKEVDNLLQVELQKVGRGLRARTSSTADVSEETTQLQQLQNELDRLAEERAKLEAQQAKIQQQEAQATSGEKRKTFLKRLLQPFKQATKGIVQSLSGVSSSIQDALKKKSKIEAKLAGKTKIFGLQTYQRIVTALRQRTAKVYPSGGNRKTRKYRKMNINKNTRKKNRRVKRKNTKKYLKRRNTRQTRYTRHKK